MANPGYHLIKGHTTKSGVKYYFTSNGNSNIAYPNSMMIVRGSDSTTHFIQKCKLTCKRNCLVNCKKSNRRINVYCGYVNKNYEDLKQDFIFYGGVDKGENHILIEDYVPERKYHAVFVTRKNV